MQIRMQKMGLKMHKFCFTIFPPTQTFCTGVSWSANYFLTTITTLSADIATLLSSTEQDWC